MVDPRGVVNLFTQQPAPTVVGRGGLIAIHGINLGPAAEVSASGAWPEKLNDVEVLINGRPAPVGLVSASRVVAQVPYETAPGVAQAVVRRGDAASRPARFQVLNLAPSLKSANGQGYGHLSSSGGSSVTLSASGLGLTEPRVPAGSIGDGIAAPAGTVRVLVAGSIVEAGVKLSNSRVGEFEVAFVPPPGSTPADVVSLTVNNQPVLNRLTLGATNQMSVLHLRLPAGVPDLRSVESADLAPVFVLATGSRGADGCYPAWTVDLARMKMAEADPCLTSSNANALSPAVIAPEGNSLAALMGPPEGEAPNPVSSRLKIFTATRDEPLAVQLPAPAVAIAGTPQGYVAILGGTQPRAASIDSVTGQVTENEPGQNAGPGPGGQPPLLLNPQIDLGDGITKTLTLPSQIGPNLVAVVAADHEDDPKKAKLALLNMQGAVTGSRDFPDGWLPLVGPQAAANPGAGGQPGGPIIINPGGGIPGGGPPVGGGPGIGVVAPRFRVPTYNDTMQGQTYYVLARKADDSRHGLIAFSTAPDGPVKAIEFPAGWYAAGCTPQLTLQVLELSRKLALFGDRHPEREAKNPCPAQGFLVLDLAAQTTTAAAVPGQGQMNAAVAPPDMNDFVYATNTDATRQGLSDALFVLDSVTASAYRLDPPPNVTAFANLTRIPELNALAGLARNRVNGDAGLVLFDLERIETRVFPTPDGFATIQFLGFLPVARKLIARGLREGNSGTQYLIYNVVNGDLTIVPNPEGVAFVGPPPATPQAGPGAPLPQAPARTQSFNVKSNSITAVTYDSERRQQGVLVVRVP